ncbi:MAG: VOC family protein [Chloroflexi bacterium]|nr:VOC family protein [Chloroflexota bacterium]
MQTLPIDSQITFLYVRELGRSGRFYQDILGFPLVLDQGSCRIYRVTGNSAFLGICERETAETSQDGLIFTLVTADVDGWYKRITSRDWACEHAPRANERYGIYHFFVRDPDGYLLEIQRFTTPDWPAPGA